MKNNKNDDYIFACIFYTCDGDDVYVKLIIWKIRNDIV